MSIHWRVSEREHPQQCHFLYFLERPLQQFCTTVKTVISYKALMVLVSTCTYCSETVTVSLARFVWHMIAESLMLLNHQLSHTHSVKIIATTKQTRRLGISHFTRTSNVTFGSLLSPTRLSVCHLTLQVHPNHRVEPLGNISSPPCTLTILWLPCKIYGDRPRGTPLPGPLNAREVDK